MLSRNNKVLFFFSIKLYTSRKNKILAKSRILLTEALKELKIRRFVESSPEALKELKIRRFVESSPGALKEPKHFRYIKLYLIYYKNVNTSNRYIIIKLHQYIHSYYIVLLFNCIYIFLYNFF
ncbi:hypothetical protein C5S42_12230 [Candidatus Methanomarinus sp.]|nr:hypothetical protein C5S42_12230 [ANME-2 cluster archaeon]